MPVKENFQTYVSELLLRMADHVRNSDSPRTKFQKTVYEARTNNLVNHLLETLDLALEEDARPPEEHNP